MVIDHYDLLITRHEGYAIGLMVQPKNGLVVTKDGIEVFSVTKGDDSETKVSGSTRELGKAFLDIGTMLVEEPGEVRVKDAE